jgi:hypothetical protein
VCRSARNFGCARRVDLHATPRARRHDGNDHAREHSARDHALGISTNDAGSLPPGRAPAHV